jgi:hypothetical protein
MTRKIAVLLCAALALAAAPAGSGVAAPAAAKSTPGTPKPLKGAMPPGPLLFHGYTCGGDCTSHQAGYAWGSTHKISNPLDCRGTSETFVEGCRAYAGIEGPLGEREIFQDED